MKDHVIEFKRTDSKAVIKVYCRENDIDLQNELNFFNGLYRKPNLSKYGFDCFFVTEIIPIKRDYFSTYCFISNRL